jgi:hypothetical protein
MGPSYTRPSKPQYRKVSSRRDEIGTGQPGCHVVPRIRAARSAGIGCTVAWNRWGSETTAVGVVEGDPTADGEGSAVTATGGFAGAEEALSR